MIERILRKIIDHIKAHFQIYMTLVMAFTIWLNWNGHGMESFLLKDYLLYKDSIHSGFVEGHSNTFPMWGYGWVMAISTNKLFLLAFQGVLALSSVFLLVSTLSKYKLLSTQMLGYFKVILVLFIPFFAAHSLRWANSFNVSLFILAFSGLLIALKENDWKYFVLSGLSFGLALNFRSEFYLMPVGYFLITVFFTRDRQKTIQMIVWTLCIYLTLIPWSVYTKNVTGHALITSTNAGHVCFIGLGNNTNNKWGIEEYDYDSVMANLLHREFGPEATSLEYKSDTFLKKEFVRRVTSDPKEYLIKCFWSAKLFITQGFYPGEFIYTKGMIKQLLGIPYNLSEDQQRLVLDSRKYKGADRLFRILVQFYSLFLGKILVLISTLLLPIVAFHAIRKKDLFKLLIVAGICYQITINVLCYQMRGYTSNMILFLLMNMLIGLALIADYRKKQKGEQSS